MVRVCDAIMGTGKSSAAITYMNEHNKDKFVYITPYLDEAARIKSGCPTLHFVEPSDKIQRYHFKKTEHTMDLIRNGMNVATTHQAFKNYTDEMLECIRDQGYTLIIDENVDVLESFDVHPDDLQMAIDSGYVKSENDIYTLTDKKYGGDFLKPLVSIMKSRELLRVDGEDDDGELKDLFYWALPANLFTSFKDVFILTYLFDGQSLHHFLKINDIPYEMIGISKDGGSYSFCDFPGYTPTYVKTLGDKLHILSNSRMNCIGEDYHALSMNWFKKDAAGVEALKRNIYNYYNNINRSIPSKRRLWASYSKEFSKIRGEGYSSAFLTFNAKATNAYKDRRCLVYATNIFMNVNEKTFYEKHGVSVDEDLYALSIMIQWIWRSAIREGEEVYLYIPSRRMRSLLEDWIKRVSNGGENVEA